MHRQYGTIYIFHLHNNTAHTNKQFMQSVCGVKKSDTLNVVSGGKVPAVTNSEYLCLNSIGPTSITSFFLILWYYAPIRNLSPADVAFTNVLCVVAHIILRDFRTSESFQTVSVTSAVTAVIWNHPHVKLFIVNSLFKRVIAFVMVMINISMYTFFHLSLSVAG